MALAKTAFSVAAAANSTLRTGAGALYGLTLREVTAVAAAGTVTLFDNTAASGPVLAVIRLAADGNFTVNWKHGVRYSTGLTLAAVGADVNGSATVGSTGTLNARPFAGADLLLQTGSVSLDSVLAAETAGAAAEWQLFDNTSAAGTPFAGFNHAANSTVKIDWPDGVRATTGLFFDQLSGATSGVAYVY